MLEAVCAGNRNSGMSATGMPWTASYSRVVIHLSHKVQEGKPTEYKWVGDDCMEYSPVFLHMAEAIRFQESHNPLRPLKRFEY